MSTAIQPAPASQSWHKLFKLAPLVIILLYMRTRPEQPVTQIGISEEFDIDRKTAAACLRQLASNGMIAHLDHNNGYVLADGGQQMLLDIDAGWGKNGHLPLKESFKDLKDSKIKDKKEGKRRMGNFWTAPAGLTTERILAETGKLFGYETIAHGIQDRSPSDAMALVAHAYDQRDRLAKPQVFVYRRLQRNEPSDKKYRTDPLAFLPNEFLHALGLAELAVVEVEPLAAVEELPDSAPVASEHAQVWERVLQQLEHEMPRGSFDTWVRDTHVLRYDGRVMVVGVRNAYTRDWLESRLTSTIHRLLIGILNQADVTVEFSVSVETEGVQ